MIREMPANKVAMTLRIVRNVCILFCVWALMFMQGGKWYFVIIFAGLYWMSEAENRQLRRENSQLRVASARKEEQPGPL